MMILCKISEQFNVKGKITNLEINLGEKRTQINLEKAQK